MFGRCSSRPPWERADRAFPPSPYKASPVRWRQARAASRPSRGNAHAGFALATKARPRPWLLWGGPGMSDGCSCDTFPRHDGLSKKPPPRGWCGGGFSQHETTRCPHVAPSQDLFSSKKAAPGVEFGDGFPLVTLPRKVPGIVTASG
jgi:hypothetical protein